MTSNLQSQSHLGQPKRTSFGGYGGNNASMFLEKAKIGNRGSTPDSEALASSDDEQEHHHRLQSLASLQSSRPVRRASWLPEIHQAPQRKGSLGGGGTFSPNASYPNTPSNESSPWANAMGSTIGSVSGRGHSSSTSVPWGSAIWSSEAQKGPPSRLTEVLPSPTTLVPPSSSSSFMEDPLLSPNHSREHAIESAIPFAIPLHPTLKSYRSQSYSVGQLDAESGSAVPNNQGGYMNNTRSRSGVSYSGLQHRPSRPSMLGDLSHDASLLGQLREVEDDDESSTESEAGVHLSCTQARTIEQLARENAMLRQQAAEKSEIAHVRSRASFTDTNSKTSRRVFSNSQRAHSYVQEDGQHGPREVGDIQTGQSYSNGGLRARRSSEYASTSSTHHAMTGIPEHRNLETFKKGHWQSSLGFGGIVEAPQSRRHSFAEVPTRQTSISPSGDVSNGAGQAVPLGYTEDVVRPSQGDSSEYTRFRFRQTVEEIQMELEHLRDRKFAASYFSGTNASLRSEDLQEPLISPAVAYQPYPPDHLYSRPQQLGTAQSRASQLFSLITFKACRGDIFYASEGTGLHFKSGDLVIVEADRGTDLGTVSEVNCSWARALELKAHATAEHKKWLMMFSRHGPNDTTAAHAIEEQQEHDLKPKVIKRLAQAHEIQQLREKEGNEAKAKRVCQQKVAEHRLNMEILDAEFQFRDWKKLTFYYFADSYINFNPLVTELFKIYKTRIWMSAINPASFQAPAPAHPIQAGLGSGAFMPECSIGPERRQYRTSPTSTTISASHAGYRDGRAWNPTQDGPTVGLMQMPNTFPQSFQAPDFGVRQLDQYSMQYPHNAQQAYGLQPRYSPAVYGLPNMSSSLYATSLDGRDDSVRTPDAIGAGWNHAFLGLSLGS
ncbi:MAG: hypothetical protein Q9209_006069 [Squamulea sp. 1 TL-2023]